jgi:cytochrome b
MTAVTNQQSDRKSRSDLVSVWDPFVRIFHWSLIALFLFAYFTGNTWDQPHEWAGYTIGGLVACRVLWGFIGSTHARFSDFAYRPAVVLSFLRDSLQLRGKRFLGHNPAGGAMVIALLSSITVICFTGHLMTTDRFWGVSWVETAHEIFVNMTLGLIVLHIAGVVLASVEHKENLVKSMVTGLKRKG